MNKVGFVDCSSAEKSFFKKALEGYELYFYNSEKDNYKQFDQTIEVLSVFVDYEVTKDIIDHLPKLKLINCRSTGFNNIDVDYAKSKGIMVANAPGYGATSVAEYVFGMILILSRKLGVVFHETFEDEVDRVAERGWDLSSRTIGIVGLGAIGRGVAKIAHGFGMNILAYEPYNKDAEFAIQHGVEFVNDLSYLCRESDIVTLHVPYTGDNHHLLNTKLLEQMKSTALVINTSRGELLNTLQLARMLHEGKLAGAGLDVIENESFLINPNATIELATSGSERAVDKLKHALAILSIKNMPNVVITNHNAFNTVEALRKINDMTVENIKGAFGEEGGKVYEVQGC